MADENGEKVLRDGTIIDSYYIEDKEEFIDTIHTKYTEHAMCLYNNAYAIYFLGGKYTTLTGTLAIKDDSDKNGLLYISIYDDNDNVIYSSGSLDRITKPIELNLDVENIDFITIKQSYYNSAMKSILYNFKAQ